PRLFSPIRDRNRSCSLRYAFPQQGPAMLDVESDPASGAVNIEETSRLDRVMYSHLNSFCDFEVRGHRRLFLEFSPCKGAAIEARPSDYPFGRPARFAFLDAKQTFRVVEATSGEKGPFRTLAQGPLSREQELTITLKDDAQAVARIVLADWPAQVDTTL